MNKIIKDIREELYVLGYERKRLYNTARLIKNLFSFNPDKCVNCGNMKQSHPIKSCIKFVEPICIDELMSNHEIFKINIKGLNYNIILNNDGMILNNESYDFINAINENFDLILIHVLDIVRSQVSSLKEFKTDNIEKCVKLLDEREEEV